MITRHLNLIEAGERDTRGIQEETARFVEQESADEQTGADNERAAIERPGALAEFALADFDGLLPAKVTRLFVSYNFMSHYTLFDCHGRVSLNSVQAQHESLATTSFLDDNTTPKD